MAGWAVFGMVPQAPDRLNPGKGGDRQELIESLKAEVPEPAAIF
jgi:hypothetical protein